MKISKRKKVSKEENEILKQYRIGLFGELGNRKKLKEELDYDNDLKELRSDLQKSDYNYPREYEEVIEKYKLEDILDVVDLNSLNEAMNGRIRLYKELVETVRQKRVRLLAFHAIFRLSERGGLQIATLAVGSVIILGMFYMWFYYQAAAGQFVHRYWTLDDLIIQGINVAWLVGLVLIGVELLFRWLLRGFESQNKWQTSMGQVLLNHPNVLVLVFLGVLLGVTSFAGQLSGTRTYDDFVLATIRDHDELESATMTDRTILRDVHLVGTTSRTAVFLQVAERDGGEFDSSPGYFETWLEIIRLLPFPNICSKVLSERGVYESVFGGSCTVESSEESAGSGKYHVLVVDRAHVLCHTKGQLCLELPKVSN